MSGYVRTYRKKWHSQALRQLSDDGWKVFDYLYSCPQGNLLGVYVLRAAAAVEDLNWLDMKDLAKGFARFTKAFKEVLEVHRTDGTTGLILYDEANDVVMVKSFIEHNPMTNPNQVKAAITKLWELPYCPEILNELKSCIREISKEYKEGLYQPLLKALDKALAKGLPKALDKGLGKDLDKGLGKGKGKALATKKKKEETETETEEEKEVVDVSPEKIPGETLPDSEEDDGEPAESGFPIFECQYFKVGEAFASKLLDEYPLLGFQDIVKIFSRIEDFIDDNPNHYKRKASGEVKSPKRIIKNWLDREEIPAQKGGGAQNKKDRQKQALQKFASS